jgi:hypothetical protein
MAHRGTAISPILTDNGSVEELNPNGGGVLNQLPSLKQTAETRRAEITRFNEYKTGENQGYGPTHANSMSDGDEHGRGENSGGVGTSIDKAEFKTLMFSSGNKYKPGNSSGYYTYDYPEQYW